MDRRNSSPRQSPFSCRNMIGLFGMQPKVTSFALLRQRARTAVGGIVDSCLARAVIGDVLIGCRLQARGLTRPAPAILRSFGGFCCGDAMQVAGEGTGSCLRFGFGPNGGRVRGREPDEVDGGVSPVLGRLTLDRDLIASAGIFFCEWGRRAEGRGRDGPFWCFAIV